MKTFKITFEVALKNDDIDWIEQAIEQGLEDGEEIIDGNIEEVTQ